MKIGTSFSVEDISDIRELVPSSDPVVFVVGAFAHGKVQSVLCTYVLCEAEAQCRIPRAVGILKIPVLTNWDVQGVKQAVAASLPSIHSLRARLSLTQGSQFL